MIDRLITLRKHYQVIKPTVRTRLNNRTTFFDDYEDFIFCESYVRKVIFQIFDLCFGGTRIQFDIGSFSVLKCTEAVPESVPVLTVLGCCIVWLSCTVTVALVLAVLKLAAPGTTDLIGVIVPCNISVPGGTGSWVA